MSKRVKTLVIVLGILVLLIGGYYGSILLKNKKSDLESSYVPPAKLGNLENTDLVKIETSTFALEKNNDIWELSYLEGGIPPSGIELDQMQIQYLTYSLATVWTESIVEEEPEDLSVYGLDNPPFMTNVTDSTGRKAEYILGDMTPSRDSYYIMEKGEPKVYTISGYLANLLQIPLDVIRQRYLFPEFALPALSALRLESAGTRIEIIPIKKSSGSYLDSSFATYVLTSPYKTQRGVNSEALNELLAPLYRLAKEDFIDDNPSSLAPYGLDKPFKIFLQTENASIDLLIGDEVNGKRYAKAADAPGVFTLSNMEGIVNVKAFGLIDKFVLLVNIDNVDHLTISGGEKNLDANFLGKGDEAQYFLNGKSADTKNFRLFYQTVIGLLTDAEYTTTVARQSEDTREITIEYRLNTPPGQSLSISLIPHNRDFYLLRQEGATEFLISRNQVRKIYQSADKL